MEIRGWCHNHETPMPLWRGGRGPIAPVLVCQLCWFDEFGSGDAHLFLSSRTDPVGLARARAIGELQGRRSRAVSVAPVRWWHRRAEANDTANSPATSEWLPRVWVNAHLDRHPDAAGETLIRWVGDAADEGPVVWVRHVDEWGRFAATTLLADQLRREEAGQ